MSQVFGPYKGFSAQVSFDATEGVLAGRIAGVSDMVGFHASDFQGLDKAFRQAVDGYIEAHGPATTRRA